MTPAQIVQVKKERLASVPKQVTAKAVNQQVIKLKKSVMFTTKLDLVEIDDVCYALVCKDALFSMDDISSTLPPSVTNLLQEYSDVFPTEIPPGLPPIRGIEHQIDLIPRATLPNRATYRANLEETTEIQRQVQDLLDAGMYVRALVLVPFQLFWF
jgi:hypothetical protein